MHLKLLPAAAATLLLAACSTQPKIDDATMNAWVGPGAFSSVPPFNVISELKQNPIEELADALKTDAPEIAACESEVQQKYPSILDALVQSTDVKDFEAKLSGYFGDWANDPLLRLAVAARLTERAALLSIILKNPNAAKTIPTDLQAYATEKLEINSFIKELLVIHFNKMPIAAMLRGAVAGTETPTAGAGQPPSTQDVKFSTLLIAYLREYFSGKFVNRFGTAVSNPGSSSSGIPDAEISGAVTVIFEAIFDFLDRTPIVTGDGGATWLPNATPASAPPAISTLWGNASKSTPTALAVMKQVATTEIYGTVPMIGARAADAKCGVSEAEARALVTLSSYVGQRTVVWNGALAEAISNVNLGTLFAGTSFAVGDNKTLVEVFKAAVEASARRSAEHLLFHVFYDTPPDRLEGLLEWFPKSKSTADAGAPAAGAAAKPAKAKTPSASPAKAKGK